MRIVEQEKYSTTKEFLLQQILKELEQFDTKPCTN